VDLLTRSLKVSITVFSLELAVEIEEVTTFLNDLELYLKVLVLLIQFLIFKVVG
jgi:hypothetical protein